MKYEITIDNAEQAVLLLELLSKAAVAGPNARHLAALYDKAQSAVKYWGSPDGS